MNPVHRRRALFCGLLLALGLVLLQALIGGRVLLFGLPGFALTGAAALLSLVLVREHRFSTDLASLGTAAFFCAYLFLRAAFTPGYYARLDLFTIVGAFVVYSLTATVISSTRARLAVIVVLLGFGIVQVAVGAAQFTRGDNFMPFPFLQRADYGQRASGFLVCPNHLAGYLEVVAIFGVALICWGRWPVWAKLLAAYATGICYLGLALTGSRGGYLSALVSLVVFGICSLVVLRAASPQSWRRFALLGGAAVLLVTISGGALISANSFLSSRAANMIDSKNVRMTLWRAAIRQWELRPLIGTGAGTFRFYGREFRTADMQRDPIDVHNDYLHLLSEYGAIGGLAFLLFFGAHARYGWRCFRRLVRKAAEERGATVGNRLALALGAWSAIAAYVVHSALDFNLHIPANAFLLAFVFGIAADLDLSTKSLPVARSFPLPIKLATAFCAAVLIICSAWLAPSEYFTERSRVALREEAPREAAQFARRALACDRRNPETFFYLGRALLATAHGESSAPERQSLHEDAIVALQAARRLAPLDGSYPLDLAFAYDELRRFDEAERMYEAARRRDPRSLAVSELYKAHLLRRGQAGEFKGPL